MSFGIPVRNGLGLGLLASTTLATRNAFGGPTLNLNFTTMTALPSTITFSRPSNATYYDSTGKLTYAPNNLLLNSATLSTQNVTTAPINYILSFQGTGSVVLSGTFIGTLTGTGVSNRVSVAFTPTAGTLTLTVVGSVTSAQLEAVTYQTTPSTYNATTSAAYYGPRLDYNPATLAARGLLIEEARTNLLPQTNNFSGASWDLIRLTRTTDTTLASDGATAAAKYTATAGAATTGAKWFTAISYTIVAGSTYATSMEVDGSSGGYPYISLTTNPANWATAIFDTTTSGDGVATQTSTTGGTIVSTSQTYLGNGRYRLTLVASVAAGTTAFGQAGIAKLSTGNTFAAFGGAIGTFLGTEYVYASFIQLELGAFATSYIPSATPPTARSADTASMTGTNFSSWYSATAGAFLVQFDTPASGTRIISAADDNTANNNIQMLTSGTDPTFLVTTSGAVQASIDAGTVAANTVYKFAGTYSANDFAACISGGTVGTDTSGTIPTVDRLRIGAGQAGNTLCGHLAYLVYYPQRLPNATLQSLTS
jgi:hypothetical protein